MNATAIQIRPVAESLGEPLSYAEAERIAGEMPVAAYAIVTSARLDAFLRGLPGRLFSLIYFVSQEFIELSDKYDVDTWDQEFLSLVLWFLRDEGVEDPTDDELLSAALDFAAIVRLEFLRREGCYEWIQPYRLGSRDLPLRIPSKHSATEH